MSSIATIHFAVAAALTHWRARSNRSCRLNGHRRVCSPAHREGELACGNLGIDAGGRRIALTCLPAGLRSRPRQGCDFPATESSSVPLAGSPFACRPARLTPTDTGDGW